jgi:fructose-1,6-bisphosphatase/inositol monophosphatase family enzyme
MEQTHQVELQRRHDVLLPVIKKLGDHVIRMFDARTITMELKSDGSKVTTADSTANDLFIVEIGLRFPQDLVWGEEGSNISGGEFGAKGDLRWMWLLDPIDGTSGFWRAYQGNNRTDCTSAVMITGFAPGATTPTLSAVHSPFLRHAFTTVASDHFGTEYYTDRAVTPRLVTLQEHGPTRMEDVQRFEENYWNGSIPDLTVMADMAPYARKVRTSSVGAAMTRLSLGDIDIVAFPGPSNPHDVAPGALIAHKAGAVVQNLEGTPYGEIDWRVGPIAGCLATPNQALADNFLYELSQ